MLLAHAGLDVTVLERLPRVGGRTATLEAEGLRFDVGPTFFLYPRILEEICTAVGEDLHREVARQQVLENFAFFRFVLVHSTTQISRSGRTGNYDVRIENQHGQLIAVFHGKSYKIRGTVRQQENQA